MITVRLGNAPANVSLAPPQDEDAARLEAAGIIASGLFSAAGIVLYAMGHEKPAAALGAAGVLTGAAVAAARVLG